MPATTMTTGIVKNYDADRGFGTISYSGGEIFVHYTQIEMDGYRQLEPGQKVKFEIVKAKKCLQAIAVKLI